MALPFFNWSRTALSNATADSTVNWAEGQAPSSVNDSARAMMASTAAFRDDISATILTGGTATAFTLTSYQVFDTLAHMSNAMIAFVASLTNTNTVGNDVTLNVDGLGAKPIRIQPSVALPNGTLILGTPYVVSYNNTDGVFYLRNMTNPYSIPLGAGMDFWPLNAPNSSFAFAYGQAISRTTYATLFGLFGGNFGVGDGSSTFNLPDKRGRVSVAADDLGGVAAGRMTSYTLGAVGGTQSNTLITANLPSHTHTGTTIGMSANANHSHTYAAANGSAGAGVNFTAGASTGTTVNTSVVNLDHTHDFTSNATGSGTALGNIQPTIACNYILRII